MNTEVNQGGSASESLLAEQTFRQAVAYHQAGQLQEAGELYRSILQTHPGHAEANHKMGLIAMQAKQPAAALPCFMAALEADPACGPYWLSYIDALLEAGYPDDAREVLALARQQGLQGKGADALASLLDGGAPRHAPGETASARPDAPKPAPQQNRPSLQEIDALLALFGGGRYDEAASLAREMTERFPLHEFGWKALGAVFQQTGQNAEALASLLKATTLSPNDADGHNSLGNTFSDMGRLDEAESSFKRALQINPNNANAHNNLGLTLHDLGRLVEAESSFRRALEINPNNANAHNNLGLALRDSGRLVEAESSFRRVLQINPYLVEAYNNLGVTLQEQGQLDKAETCFQQALQIKPDYAAAHSNLIFALDMADTADLSELHGERKKWDEVHAAPLWRDTLHSNDRSPDRRLRVGYISADFREHSATKVFGGMLTRYDRSQFEVFAYSNFNGKDDRFTDLFKQNVTVWRNIGGLPDDAVAKLIREDRIDILVDLSGFTVGNRLLVFARKPAPIQITAWGYATSTGMRAMDVFFADPVMVPPEDKRYFTEEVRYLPCVVGAFFIDRFPDVNELPALSDGIVTFGSLNRLAKVSENSFRAWAEVLRAIPGSRLILKSGELDDASTRERVIKHFTKAGVAAERIIMLGKTSWHEHVQAYNRIDIALDPFPHGGGVTALEGLMMGVPLVTLRWPTVAGRLSASIMTALGLTDWIAETREQYVRLAMQKASDLQSLDTLRRALRDIFTSSIIGDQVTYVRAVEQEYRQLWQEWCIRQHSTKIPEKAISCPDIYSANSLKPPEISS